MLKEPTFNTNVKEVVMLRNDFVSNSSSTSFVFVLKEESDEYCFPSTPEPDYLNLDEYMRQYGREEIFGPYWKNEPDNVKFVTPEKLQKMFSFDIEGVLPNTAKNEFKEYKKFNVNTTTLEESRKSWKIKDALFKDLIEKVTEALRPVWGKETFISVDASDYNDEGENEEEMWSDVSVDTKFHRRYSHH